MNFRSTNTLYAAFTFGAAFLVLAFFYHTVLFDPNNYLFAPNGDGIQNYYTYMFHARYDTSFWEFSGLNYPFGEHVVYTGAQPLLSWMIGFMGLEEYGIGILNFLMLISYPICAVFLFKIFRHYRLPNAIALLAAVAITFMSPQVFRMTGHLSLSPVFVIPMMWWLLIKVNQTKRIGWSIGIALFSLWCFFTHPYLGLILLMFGFVFWVVNFIADRSSWKQMGLNIAIQIVVPFVVFQLLVAASDTHLDRLGTPSGFFHYYANWKSIFVAHHGPLSYLTVLFDINIGNWESWNYVGLATAVFAGTIIVYTVRNRREIDFKRLRKDELMLFMITAFLILMFSFCFPLKYEYLRGIVDYFGPLKQFRVLGRFAWVFFYVFSVSCIILFYRLMQKKNSTPMKITLVCGLAFYFVEFYPAHRDNGLVVSTAPNEFKEESLDEDLAGLVDFVKTGGYDAFIFLPFTHLSSENILLIGTEQANYESFILSYQTGKPMMNAISSRMSLSESILINNFFSPEYVEKELVYRFPENHRILVIKNNEGVKPGEARLIWMSKKVYENKVYKAFEFNAEKWNTSYYFDEVVADEKDAVYDLGSGWKSDTNTVWFHYESFNEKATDESFGGAGAMQGAKQGYNIFLELTKDHIKPGFYQASFWYYIGVDRPDIDAVVEPTYNNGREMAWLDQFPVAQSTYIVDNWCYVELEFEFTSEMDKVILMFVGNGNQQPYYLDEVLVREQNSPALFSRQSRNGIEYIIYNNLWLRADSFQAK